LLVLKETLICFSSLRENINIIDRFYEH
jgi:hypothetical protein